MTHKAAVDIFRTAGEDVELRVLKNVCSCMIPVHVFDICLGKKILFSHWNIKHFSEETTAPSLLQIMMSETSITIREKIDHEIEIRLWIRTYKLFYKNNLHSVHECYLLYLTDPSSHEWTLGLTDWTSFFCSVSGITSGCSGHRRTLRFHLHTTL